MIGVGSRIVPSGRRFSVSYALTGDFGKFPSGFPETTHVVQGHLIVKRFPVLIHTFWSLLVHHIPVCRCRDSG